VNNREADDVRLRDESAGNDPRLQDRRDQPGAPR
jgi:hypothetical protein